MYKRQLHDPLAQQGVVVTGLIPNLVEADQVDADDLDVDQQFIRAQLGGVVDSPCLLGQGVGRRCV